MTDKQTEALKLALEALELVRVSGLKKPATHMEAIGAIREALAEQPAQQQEPQGLIRQSEEDFQRFLKTTNLKAINGRKTLAALAWRISHQQTKKRINQMKASQAFDDGGAQDLTILNVHSKNFLKELAVHAREACDVVVPEWAEKYGSLASAAEELVKMIERTEVVHE